MSRVLLLDSFSPKKFSLNAEHCSPSSDESKSAIGAVANLSRNARADSACDLRELMSPDTGSGVSSDIRILMQTVY